MRQGQCRYAMPWNKCLNAEGNHHHAEATMVPGKAREKRFKMQTEAFLDDDDHTMRVSQWMHDEHNLTWEEIFKTLFIPSHNQSQDK